MSERELTCIVCPRGCPLVVTLKDGAVHSVRGHGCKRGAAYAEAECTHPVRTLTTTVRLCDGRVLAVKTSAPIPKESLFSAMEQIRFLRPCAPVHAGDVLATIEGVPLVATADVE